LLCLFFSVSLPLCPSLYLCIDAIREFTQSASAFMFVRQAHRSNQTPLAHSNSIQQQQQQQQQQPCTGGRDDPSVCSLLQVELPYRQTLDPTRCEDQRRKGCTYYRCCRCGILDIYMNPSMYIIYILDVCERDIELSMQGPNLLHVPRRFASVYIPILDPISPLNLLPPSQNGETPLYISCVGNHISLVKLLLEKGANFGRLVCTPICVFATGLCLCLSLCVCVCVSASGSYISHT